MNSLHAAYVHIHRTYRIDYKLLYASWAMMMIGATFAHSWLLGLFMLFVVAVALPRALYRHECDRRERNRPSAKVFSATG